MPWMKRRKFITFVAGAARVQQTDRIRRIGVFMNLAADDPEGQDRKTAFVHALQQLGWTDSGLPQGLAGFAVAG